MFEKENNVTSAKNDALEEYDIFITVGESLFQILSRKIALFDSMFLIVQNVTSTKS